MPEARSLRDEIDSYKDDIASARDERMRELSIKRLADAEGRLEAFLSKPLERNAEAPDPETSLNKTPAEQELETPRHSRSCRAGSGARDRSGQQGKGGARNQCRARVRADTLPFPGRGPERTRGRARHGE